jgi:hypothetical protein
MKMSKATFTKVSKTDAPLYGPKKLLLSGFPAKAQPLFLKVMEMAGIADVPTVWANTHEDADTILADLMAKKDKTGWEVDSELPRAVIVAGIKQKELPVLMSTCRQAGMGEALWAVLTPTSETWPLKQLLAELESERCAMQKKGK